MSHRRKQDAVSKALAGHHLRVLQTAAQSGLVQLKYLDESGVCLWSPASYSYSPIGQQKRLEQTERRGARVSLLGLWSPDECFDYALVTGGYNAERYIEVMDQAAAKAARVFAESARLTLVIQDNCSIHRAVQVQQRWPLWQQQGLFVLFLPPYCSELNLIEGQWHQLKTHELAGRMFDYEDELMEAIVDAIDDRAQRGRYTAEHLVINYA